jgi:hypothetical protein
VFDQQLPTLSSPGNDLEYPLGRVPGHDRRQRSGDDGRGRGWL